MALTDIKIAFCYEYIVDFHRMNAMKRIGYTGKHPSVICSQWLEDPEIKNKIQELRDHKMQEVQVSAVDVLNELKTIISSDVKDFIDEENNIVNIKKLPSSLTRAVSSITKTKRYNMFGEEEETVKISFWDKNAALTSLGKHFGIFEVDNNQKRPLIQVNISD